MGAEYGKKEKTYRPHYHYIIFGYDFPDKYKWKKKNGYQLYRSSLLEQCWPHGQADIAECNFDTIQYVAKYVTKKISGEKGDDYYRRQLPDGTNYWLQPEFGQMSRNPGLGAEWFQKYKSSVYPHDRVVINETPAKPPRYYDQLLQRVDPDQLELVKKKRAELVLDQTPERLRAGEVILRAKLKQP